jgi:hypothetical protein
MGFGHGHARGRAKFGLCDVVGRACGLQACPACRIRSSRGSRVPERVELAHIRAGFAHRAGLKLARLPVSVRPARWASSDPA